MNTITGFSISLPTKKGYAIYIYRNDVKTLFGYWPTLESAQIEINKLKILNKHMELNYFKNKDSNLDPAKRAGAILLGGIEAIRSIAWLDNDYKTCARANRIIESALEKAGPEWHFYQKAQEECNEYQHKLNAIKTINGN